jgi:hypothetical protein
LSRIYAVEEDSGRRVLIRIECDGPMCTAKITPSPDIAQSRWVTWGCKKWDTKFEYAYCPDHADLVPSNIK